MMKASKVKVQAEGASFAFPSKIGLGTWQFCEAVTGLPTPAESKAIFEAAWERGVRHVDTAQSYGNGRSEVVVGQILEGRHDVFLATKIHYKPSVEETVEAVRASLVNLRREQVDLVYLHWPRKALDVRPVMEGLEKARRLGLIRYVGASNFTVKDLVASAEVASVDAFQIGYSLLWRYPERDVLPWCLEHGIAFVTYSALAQGLLAGKIKDLSRFVPGDPRPDTVFYDEGVFPKVLEAVGRMEAAASREGLSLARAALAWVLGQAGVTSSLLGAKSPAQLDEILSEDLGGLSGRHSALLEELTRISGELAPSIPDVGNMFRAEK